MSAPEDPTCLFCRIVAGEIPSTQIYSDEQVVAFRDVNPQAPVHVLTIPRHHIAGINTPEAEGGAILSALVRTANQIARAEGVGESGYRLVWNVGPNAGQSVFHLHLHLLGGRPLGWPPG
jgi:histidine triad (HIT) family protein